MRKYIWVHSFNNTILNSGVFMHTFYNYFNQNCNIDMKLFFIGKKTNLFSYIFGWFKLLNDSSFLDVLHVQYGSFSGFICSLLPRKKIITLRGSDIIPITTGNYFTKFHSRIGIILTKYSLVRYDKILVMSHRMKQCVPLKYQYKIEVIPDPIDLNKFVIKNKIECRKRIFPNIDSSKILVLFTAIDIENPIKRYSLASEAIDILNKISNHSYQLVTATVIENDKMVDVYNAVDICLLTSSHEGWPNCIKEAMSCNIPFVSTDVSDLHLIVSKTKNCFISEPNASEIANKILKIQLDRNENLRELIGFLSLENVSFKLQQVYNSI
jgi:teichuronic acid biosynthesis glycosyltransferase TuaC